MASSRAASLPSPIATAGGAGVLILVLLPLVGLLVSLGEPAPFATKAEPLSSLLAGSGAIELLLRTLALAVLVGTGSVALGTSLAWADARLDFAGRRILGVLSLLPLAMPSYVLAATMAASLGPGGWIGGPLGFSRPTGFLLATLALIAITTPLVQLVVSAALARSSAAEEEAARCLGASPWQVFRLIVLPRLRPAIALSCLLSMLYAVSDFGAVAVLDVPVLTWRLYDAVRGQEIARAAVLGVATLGATIPLFAAARFLRGRHQPEAGVANPRPPARIRPHTATWIATLTGFSLVIGIGLVLPTLTLVGWVADGIQRDLAFANPWTAVGHTLLAALFGALLTLVLAWLPAWASGRGQRGGRTVEQGLFLTSALPGVLLALGLMQAALALSRAMGGGALYHALLGSGTLLFMGYASRFAAEVFAPLRTSVLSLDLRLLESAQLLGATPSRRFKHVVLPSVAPGVAIAFLLGFVAILKELPVTLLLGGATGLHTLAFRMWDRYNEALWHDAGVAGLLLVGAALTVVVATLKWRRHV